MTQIATTIEQMLRLIDCGVNENTSDMCQHLRTAVYYTHGYENLPNTLRNENKYVPAWSLSRLLDLLPKKLTVGIKVHELNMGAEPCAGNFYIRYINSLTGGDDLDSYTDAADTIEACVRMIEWLTKHSYELNTIKQ